LFLESAASQDGFGTSLAMSGDLLVVGIPGRAGPDGEDGAGEVCVFREMLQEFAFGPPIACYNGGAHEQRRLGFSVAIDGHHIAVGAQFGINGSGEVLILRLDGDTLQPLDTIDALLPNSGFGTSVAIREIDPQRYVVVMGAPYETLMGNFASGSAYAYGNNGSSGDANFIHLFRPVAPQADGFFGTAVAISSRFVAVGAPGRTPVENGNNTGSVTVFRPNDAPAYVRNGEYGPGGIDSHFVRCGTSISVDPSNRSQFVFGCPNAVAGFSGGGVIRVTPLLPPLSSLLVSIDNLYAIGSAPTEDIGYGTAMLGNTAFAIGVDRSTDFDIGHVVTFTRPSPRLFADGFEVD
jgi:hypothetical protein